MRSYRSRRAKRRVNTRKNDYHPKTGRKRVVKGVTTEKRKEEVRQLFADLDEYKKQFSREKLAALVAEVTAKYDGYSENNALLISMQRPTATDVDSRSAWLERGRLPKGTGTGIKIVRPVKKWEEPNPDDPDDPIVHVSYDTWHVFDVSTTIENTLEAEAKWKADHPEGKWHGELSHPY